MTGLPISTSHFIFSQRPEIGTQSLVSRLRPQHLFSGLPLCSGLKSHLFSEKRENSKFQFCFFLEAAEYAVKLNIYNSDCTLAARIFVHPGGQVLFAIYEAAAQVNVSVWLGRKIQLFFLQACCIHT